MTVVLSTPHVSESPLILSARYRTGDADLYISNENSNPTYEPSTYILHSATCGDDFVHIHKK